MSKRGNGEGTLYQRKDGRWAGAYVQDGQRKAIYGRTRAEVGARLTVALKARADGRPIVNEQKTVGAYLTEWLEAVRPSLRARTWDRYEELLRLHVVPGLGQTPIARLAPEQLQRLYAAKLAEGSASTTVHHIHAVVHRALSQAERWGRVSRNVASLVDAPRLTRHEMATLSEEELRRFGEAVVGDPFEALFVLACTTGMRLSEILGLRWRDVDLERAEVQLRTTLERHRDQFRFVEPKTRGSRRSASMTSVTPRRRSPLAAESTQRSSARCSATLGSRSRSTRTRTSRRRCSARPCRRWKRPSETLGRAGCCQRLLSRSRLRDVAREKSHDFGTEGWQSGRMRRS